MYTIEKEVTISQEVGQPEVFITGQTPDRKAVITFPIFENGERKSEIRIEKLGEEFDTFYKDWDSDTYLYGLIEGEFAPKDIEIPENILNIEPVENIISENVVE